MSHSLNLQLLPDLLAVCRLAHEDTLPAWALSAPFLSITRTADELSIVCPQAAVPPGIACETGWRALKVQGPLDFGLTGVLAALLNPLAATGVSIFALSTYDTDYILVKDDRLAAALQALRAAGHQIDDPDG